MNDLMKKDITIRIISVFFAILLWLFVLNNIDNPFSKTYISVPVKVQNENSLMEKGLGLKNKNFLSSVEIEVRGRKDQLSTFTSRDVELAVDFSTIKDAGKKELEIQVLSRKDNIQIADINPKTISVDIDRVVKKNFKVQVVPVGTAKESYKIIRTAANPDTVTIEGLESVMDSAESVKTTVDINKLDKSIVIRKECKVYNKNDEEIVGLNRNLEVEINVEVAKEVPVTAIVTGKPSGDFVETGHKVNVDRVAITGLPEVLDSITELSTESVNIDNLNKNTDIKTTIRLPEGVKLVDSVKEVIVSVSVEKLVVMNYEVKKENLTLLNMDEDTYKYDISSDSFIVKVKGRQRDLDFIDQNVFKPTVDVAGLEEGTHNLPVKITLPDSDVKLSEEVKIEIRVSKK